MAIGILKLAFEGPFEDPYDLENHSGVYAVLARHEPGGDRYRVIDVGESGGIRDRILNHNRKACWQTNSLPGGLAYAALYIDASKRLELEQTLRTNIKLPCGER